MSNLVTNMFNPNAPGAAPGGAAAAAASTTQGEATPNVGVGFEQILTS